MFLLKMLNSVEWEEEIMNGTEVKVSLCLVMHLIIKVYGERKRIGSTHS
jgi:hypothetical protein